MQIGYTGWIISLDGVRSVVRSFAATRATRLRLRAQAQPRCRWNLGSRAN